MKFLSLALILASQSLAQAQKKTIDDLEIHPDFEIRRMASEPIVFDPVDMEFDEQGRVYVLELAGYPVAPEDPEHFPGKIVQIRDTDGDGVYDQRILFAERFQYATSILPYRGGLLVADPPRLIYLKDSDGDGRADQREVLMDGFEVGNSQHNYNGLIYGLDNWIYAGSGGNSGTVHWTGKPDESFPLRGRDFRLRPDTQEIDFTGRTSSGYCVALDDWGHVFSTHNMYPVYHLLFPDRYLLNNPGLRGTARTRIFHPVSPTGLYRIYPIGVQESRVNHPEQSGYNSGSCGITYYGGGAFPQEFDGNLFVADVVLNLVSRFVLSSQNSSFRAERARSKVEFLASSNRSFRPVKLTVGPDGALYVLDFHRRVIEHPEWIPDELEESMDIDAGKEKGRIYRITPVGGLPRVTPDLKRKNWRQVIPLLGHSNKWWRDTAQRLLVEWNLPESIPILEQTLSKSTIADARVHSMWTLHGMKNGDSNTRSLSEDSLIKALKDVHGPLRENALIAAEDFKPVSEKLLTEVVNRIQDENTHVQLQASLTSGWLISGSRKEGDNGASEALIQLLEEHIRDEWIQKAIMTSGESLPFRLLEKWMRQGRLPLGFSAEELQAGLRFANQAAENIAVRKRVSEMQSSLERIEELDQDFAAALLDGFAEGIETASDLSIFAHIRNQIRGLKFKEPIVSAQLPLGMMKINRVLKVPPQESLRTILTRARGRAADSGLSTSVRLGALKLLQYVSFSERLDLLFSLLDFKQPAQLQQESIRQLTQEGSSTTARQLIALWSQLSPETRRVAGNFLLFKKQNHNPLLTALEDGSLPLGQFNLDLERRRTLLFWSGEETGRRAAKLFTDAGVVTRADALNKMKPALRLTGKAEQGREVFLKVCALCHRMDGAGTNVGPDLTEIYRKSSETLLHDILDPNAAVDTEYLAFTVETGDDQIFTGIVLDESDTTLVIRMAGGLEKSFNKKDILTIRSDGLSLMPEELESGLGLQEMADLFAYLQVKR